LKNKCLELSKKFCATLFEVDKFQNLSTLHDLVKIESPLGKFNNKKLFMKFHVFWEMYFYEKNCTFKEIFAQEDKVILKINGSVKCKKSFSKRILPETELQFEGFVFFRIKEELIYEINWFSNISQEVKERINNKFEISNLFTKTHQNIGNLTEREIQVLSLWVAGFSLKESASILDNISERTIETHRSNLKLKLNIYNKRRLYDFIKDKGILTELINYSILIAKKK